MKGPFERLKYDLRRVWECPECHHRERADGTVTTLVCRCQSQKDLFNRVAMKLVEDRIQRRFPVFVPPADAEEVDAAAVAVSAEEAVPLAEEPADDTPEVSRTSEV
ncbi:MAG: hypothetical protein HYV60_11695 [Planctomycetia bacterium]|nr:hypothetical protein [Planctomycetia bacterium]